MMIFSVVYIVWANLSVRTQGKEDYEYLHSAAIRGVISRLGIAHHKTSFTVDTGTYIFAPVTLPGKDFDVLASPGDSIIKEAYSDTLTLIKGTRHYRFHFSK